MDMFTKPLIANICLFVIFINLDAIFTGGKCSKYILKTRLLLIPMSLWAISVIISIIVLIFYLLFFQE